MTSPRPRLEEATNDFEHDLLRSWEAERPPADGRERVLEAIAAASGAGAATTTTTAAKVALLTPWRSLALAAVLASAGAFTLPAMLRDAPAPAPPIVPSATAPAPIEPPPIAVPEPPPIDEVPPPAPMPAPSPPLTRAERKPRRVVAAAPSASIAEPKTETKVAAHALGEQVLLLDEARRQLAAGDASTALRRIDDYDRQFPSGSLSQEATELRIEALLRLGRRDEASDLGRRFVAAHPKSPYAAKVRRLVGIEEPIP